MQQASRGQMLELSHGPVLGKTIRDLESTPTYGYLAFSKPSPEWQQGAMVVVAVLSLSLSLHIFENNLCNSGTKITNPVRSLL